MFLHFIELLDSRNLDLICDQRQNLPMRILTGIQASGKLHIGNYFGAIDPAVQLQTKGDAYYFIANYHSMSSLHDASILRSNTQELAVDFLACGLNPEKAVFFRQSDVPEVHELAWILSTICPMGLLERCHSYKDKVAKGISANHALFSYPVLMAADILLYDAQLVPVGKDQKQHLEVTRDIALKFNEQFGESILTVPESLISEDTAIIPGVDGQKMSKSYGNTIPIFGEEKALRKIFMRIVTDSSTVEDSKSIEKSTILELYKLFSTTDQYQEMIHAFQKGGQGYGHFKQQLWEAYWEFFAPMRLKRNEILKDSSYVESVLKSGAQRARETALKVIDRVRLITGLR
jgi:tryptophanyl-tRNA synthetase